jgi:hypothetical protein|tara:strand:+ start:694 stop:945 length:252 start_codon:yes stop_codon:yes gene_type:complete
MNCSGYGGMISKDCYLGIVSFRSAQSALIEISRLEVHSSDPVNTQAPAPGDTNLETPTQGIEIAEMITIECHMLGALGLLDAE